MLFHRALGGPLLRALFVGALLLAGLIALIGPSHAADLLS